MEQLFETGQNHSDQIASRPATSQISLHIHAVRSVSLLGTLWVAKDLKSLQLDRDDSD